MAKIKAEVTRGSHEIVTADGERKTFSKGETFECDSSLLDKYPEKLKEVREAKAEATKTPEPEPEPAKKSSK